MTAAQSFDAPSPFALKLEKEDCSNDDAEDEDEDDDEDDDDDDENNDEDVNSVSSLTQPSILDKDCFEHADPRDEFLRLTSMVRRVYFSYLHKSVISNYNICCQPKEKEVSKSELKKFASQMELCAVKASLEASLYRQTMLKMISDIKGSTSLNKVHKKLTIFLETPSNRTDVAVQTSEDYSRDSTKSDSSYLAKDVHIQSAFVTSNFDENLTTKEPKEQQHHKNLDDRISELLKNEEKILPKKEIEVKPKRINNPSREAPKIRMKREECPTLPPLKSPTDDRKRKVLPTIAPALRKTDKEPITRESQRLDNQMFNDMQDIFGNEDATMITKPLRNEDEGSQDSLMQHLEDMFCESDDSSDLMTLIEKHSGVTKANVDSEIGKMCPEETTPTLPLERPAQKGCGASRSCPEKQLVNTTEANKATANKRKLSFSSYKKMKKRAKGEPETPPHEETPEERQSRKVRGIWFVERVHQVTKLEARMMELSVKNYRKHGRLCAKFIELFGDLDEDEMMPESPIHIEEHLTACKERIAPWVVKYLMPYYTKRVIRNRLLFKTVAKHIADMLIIENTFPEDDCVSAYVKDYFRNKTCIKAESDIYI